MSSALSNQSFVCDETGYKELYPSGYKDPDDLSERSLFATSPSSKNEDMELAEPEEGSDDGEEQRIKSVVGTDEFRVCYQNGQSITLCPRPRRHTLKPLELTTKYLTTSPSVYLISQKNATMKGWTM